MPDKPDTLDEYLQNPDTLKGLRGALEHVLDLWADVMRM